MMRILVGAAVPRDETQGAAGTLCMTIDALRRAGHDVHELWADDLEPRRIRHPNSYYLAELPWRYREAVRARSAVHPFDVTQLSQPHAWLAAADHQRRRAPGIFVNRSHGWEAHVYEVARRWPGTEPAKPAWRRAASGVMRRLLARHERLAVRFSDGLVVTSSDDRDFLVRRYGLSRAAVLTARPGLPDDYLTTPVEPCTPERLGRWLYVGQFTPVKAPDVVAGVVNRALASHPRVEMTWVTQGEHHAAVRRLLRPEVAGRVRLVAWQPREALRQIYDQHGVFLFPSYYEGFAKAFVEAMSRGLCVVATAVDGMRETITSGANGFLSAPGDVEGLTAQAVALLDDHELSRRVSAAARRTALDFTWARSAESLIAFWSELLDRKRARRGAEAPPAVSLTSVGMGNQLGHRQE